MYSKLSNDEYARLLNKTLTNNPFMPKEPIKKKLNLKQIFFFKKKFGK